LGILEGRAVLTVLWARKEENRMQGVPIPPDYEVRLLTREVRGETETVLRFHPPAEPLSPDSIEVAVGRNTFAILLGLLGASAWAAKGEAPKFSREMVQATFSRDAVVVDGEGDVIAGWHLLVAAVQPQVKVVGPSEDAVQRFWLKHSPEGPTT
jgi:hypothetical protein